MNSPPNSEGRRSASQAELTGCLKPIAPKPFSVPAIGCYRSASTDSVEISAVLADSGTPTAAA